jgi:hypothetical protein
LTSPAVAEADELIELDDASARLVFVEEEASSWLLLLLLEVSEEGAMLLLPLFIDDTLMR